MLHERGEGDELENQFGLSRDIPADVKRQVRKACGFGCVICGMSIVEYEHIDPEFKDARKHEQRAIALLCPQCHAKVTRGFLSKQSVKEAMLEPCAKRQGYSNEFFDIGKTQPKLIFGGVTLTNCAIPIEVSGVPLFEIKAGEEPGAPFRLSGTFHNSRGQPSLEIVDNEWRAFDSNWDMEAVGGAIVVRDGPRHVSLRLVAEPPDGLLVEQLDMSFKGIRFIGSPGELKVQFPGGGGGTFTGCLADNCHVGMSF